MDTICTTFVRRYREIRYQLFKKTAPTSLPPHSSVDIDLIIPVLEKDLTILPLCLNAARRFVVHPIRRIYLVAPPSEKMMAFAAEQGVEWVDERSVLGFGVEDIGFKVDSGEDRSGWIFQQLLKLSATIGTAEHYLTLDADHILLRPHTFITDKEKVVFYRSREFVNAYRTSVSKLLNQPLASLFDLSYVAHKMLFERAAVRSLHSLLEAGGEEPWYQVILRSLDRSTISPFSEFELYAHFYPEAKRESMPWREKSLDYAHVASLDDLIGRFGQRYHAITFPEYENKP